MKIETAIRLLIKEYDKAKKQEHIRNPVAYALYQVWREADAREYREKKRGNRNV